MTNSMANNRIIMVVDDEPAIGEILTMVLTEKNYAVISFTRAQKALNHLAANEAVGLLLTDMQMPEMTGLELARQVKTLYPKMPIICMSGSADGRDREEVFKLGADFIAKPFDLPELLVRINSLITQKALNGQKVALPQGRHGPESIRDRR